MVGIWKFKLLSAAALALLLAPDAVARDSEGEGRTLPTISQRNLKLDENIAIANSEAALGRRIANYVLQDVDGKPVELADFLGKPLAVSFVYTSCFDTCPTITASVADAIKVGRKALGQDSFNVITIGFDVAKDSPQAMRSFARAYGIRDENWHFLSGDLINVTGLAEELGFAYISAAGGYQHISQISVIDKEGVVYRQVWGENFPASHLVEPLKELVFGTTTPYASFGDLVNKIKLFCTIYDPTANAYRFEYTKFWKIGVGLTIILSLIYWVGINWLRIFRQERVRKVGSAATATQKDPASI